MRTSIAFGALCLLVGCGPNLNDQAIEQCRKQLEDELLSPSSLKVVEANAYFERDGQAWIKKPGEADKVTVFMQYDADNAFGAALRSRKACEYAIANGVLGTANIYDPNEPVRLE